MEAFLKILSNFNFKWSISVYISYSKLLQIDFKMKVWINNLPQLSLSSTVQSRVLVLFLTDTRVSYLAISQIICGDLLMLN